MFVVNSAFKVGGSNHSNVLVKACLNKYDLILFEITIKQ